VRLGVLGGYTNINQKFHSTSSASQFDIFLDSPAGFGPTGIPQRSFQALFTVSGLDREIAEQIERKFNGGTLGFSSSIAKENFFSDTVAKVDRYQIEQVRVSTNSRGQFAGAINTGADAVPRYDINGGLIPNDRPGTNANFCVVPAGGVDQFDLARRRAQIAEAANQFRTLTTSSNFDTHLTNFIVGNVSGFSYRLGDGWTLDPFVGTQMTVAHYGNNADQLGLKDGFALRLEGGTRIGHLSVFENGVNWVNSARLSVYSDVIVNGFVVGSAGSSDNNDEGKVRGRGAFESRILFPNGVSLFGEVNGRVGEDYWAVGGKLGGRVEW
jgi:hypothetical protein